MTEPLPEISFEDFKKCDIRVGEIVEAENIPKSSKLLRLQVDFGSFKRQIVAGIGQKYAPDDLISERLLFVINIPPAKLMGVESHGMILCAHDSLGAPLVLHCDAAACGCEVG